MTGVAQLPALISATGVSPEPRMKLPRGALALLAEGQGVAINPYPSSKE
jgi:hypothetical protein